MKTYLVIPSNVWGLASGRLVDVGVQNPQSKLIPTITRGDLDKGKAMIVGEGKNIWGHVQIDEGKHGYCTSSTEFHSSMCLCLVADFYPALFKSILENPATAHGYEGIYFLENDQCTFYEVFKAVGKALFEVGKISSPELVPYSAKEIEASPLVRATLQINCILY